MQQQQAAAEQQDSMIQSTLSELQILQASAAELRGARGLTEAEVDLQPQERTWMHCQSIGRAPAEMLQFSLQTF